MFVESETQTLSLSGNTVLVQLHVIKKRRLDLEVSFTIAVSR